MCTIYLRTFRNDKNLNYQFNFCQSKIIFSIVLLLRSLRIWQDKGMQRVINLWSEPEIISRWLIAAKIIAAGFYWVGNRSWSRPAKRYELNGFIVYLKISYDLIREIGDILLYLVHRSRYRSWWFLKPWESSAHVFFII